MMVELAYVRTGLSIELPGENLVKCLGYRPAEPLTDPVDALRQCLQKQRPMPLRQS